MFQSVYSVVFFFRIFVKSFENFVIWKGSIYLGAVVGF